MATKKFQWDAQLKRVVEVEDAKDLWPPLEVDAFQLSTFKFDPSKLSKALDEFNPSKPGRRMNIKGRNMGKTQAMKDAADQQLQDAYVNTLRVTSSQHVPTVYPTLRRRGLIVEIELPVTTPTSLVLVLAAVAGFKKIDDYRAQFPYHNYDIVQEFLYNYFAQVNEIDETEPKIDPTITPIELFVEYVGQCRSRDSGQAKSVVCGICRGSGMLSPFAQTYAQVLRGDCPACQGSGRIVSASTPAYASGWVDGGWNARFPEDVLRAYFGDPIESFNGDFHAYLLKSKDMKSAYWTLAKQYHPDRKGGDAAQFRKLAEAYAMLSNPRLRKRYEAGLKFQLAAKGVEKEVVFSVPRSCGRVTVKGKWESVTDRHTNRYGSNTYLTHERAGRLLNVTEIIKWDYVVDQLGRVMVATWDMSNGNYGRAQRSREQHGQKPFTVSWEHETEFEIKVDV